MQLYDGRLVETVGIPADKDGGGRLTVCVSSQVSTTHGLHVRWHGRAVRDVVVLASLAGMRADMHSLQRDSRREPCIARGLHNRSSPGYHSLTDICP